MQRIENQYIDDANIAHGVLSWIVYANRPLNIREVQHALAVEPELTYVGDDVLIDEASSHLCAWDLLQLIAIAG